jgi:hypothetical protein
MSMTEPERHELYELAKRDVSERFAQLMIKALPQDPERLATKDDLAVLGSELRAEMSDLRGDLRAEMADLRGDLRAEMAQLRGELKTEMQDLTTGQTRTMMLGLVGSVTALAITQLVVAAL